MVFINYPHIYTGTGIGGVGEHGEFGAGGFYHRALVPDISPRAAHRTMRHIEGPDHHVY